MYKKQKIEIMIVENFAQNLLSAFINFKVLLCGKSAQQFNSINYSLKF